MPLKILFMGSPETAIPSLKALVRSGHTIVGVVSQPARPAGRGQGLTQPAVAKIALENRLPLLQPERVQRNPELLDAIRRVEPDLIVVVAYGKILPREILEVPPKKCLNVHFSLLPKYRGAAPVQWALINEEEETGVTTFYLTERLDAGPILLQKKVPIEPEDNAGLLGHRLAVAGAALLLATLEGIEAGTVDPIPQNDRLATQAPPLKKEDGTIDWERKASVIWGQVRGMNPWPGATTHLDKKVLKIYSASPQSRKKPGSPGEIVGLSPEAIEVACGQGTLLVRELQLEGRRRMAASEFLKGCPLEAGQRFGP